MPPPPQGAPRIHLRLTCLCEGAAQSENPPLPFRLRSRSIDTWLVVLGLAALVCLSPIGATIAVIAAISIIGLPITLILAAIPPIFVFLLCARIAHILLALVGVRFWPFSAVLALAALAVVPLLENRRLEAAVATLMSGDMDGIVEPPAMRTLAFVTAGSARDKGRCDDFCQRALLKQSVGRIVMIKAKPPLGEPDDASEGTMYRLEQRAACPDFDLSDGMNNLSMPGEIRQWGDKSPADLLRLKAASGTCLIAEPARLSDADAVLVWGAVTDRNSANNAGLDPFADTIRADRLSFYSRDEGRLVERYRSTGVTYSPLLPLLLPSYSSGYGLELKPGFLRRTAYRGEAKIYHPAPPLEPFLQKSLGFDLAIGEEDQRDTSTDEIIVAALDQPGPIDRARVKVMADFFEGIHRRKDATHDDAVLAARILEDRRVPVPRSASAPVRKFAANDPALAARFAAALFGRLFEIPPGEKEDHPTYLGYSIGYLASAIASLPADAIRPYRAELERLARDPEARVNAYVALRRLSVFGADAIPTLIYLIDDSASYRADRNNRNAWQHPYLAGVQGLCGIGQEAGPAIPLIYERLDDGTIVKFASYWDMTINTLVSLGADPDEMWNHLQTSDKNHTRERFDREVSRARKKRDCSY